MPIELPVDKWPGAVRTVTLGALSTEGGRGLVLSP